MGSKGAAAMGELPQGTSPAALRRAIRMLVADLAERVEDEVGSPRFAEEILDAVRAECGNTRAAGERRGPLTNFVRVGIDSLVGRLAGCDAANLASLPFLPQLLARIAQTCKALKLEQRLCERIDMDPYGAVGLLSGEFDADSDQDSVADSDNPQDVEEHAAPSDGRSKQQSASAEAETGGGQSDEEGEEESDGEGDDREDGGVLRLRTPRAFGKKLFVFAADEELIPGGQVSKVVVGGLGRLADGDWLVLETANMWQAKRLTLSVYTMAGTSREQIIQFDAAWGCHTHGPEELKPDPEDPASTMLCAACKDERVASKFELTTAPPGQLLSWIDPARKWDDMEEMAAVLAALTVSPCSEVLTGLLFDLLGPDDDDDDDDDDEEEEEEDEDDADLDLDDESASGSDDDDNVVDDDNDDDDLDDDNDNDDLENGGKGNGDDGGSDNEDCRAKKSNASRHDADSDDGGSVGEEGEDGGADGDEVEGGSFAGSAATSEKEENEEGGDDDDDGEGSADVAAPPRQESKSSGARRRTASQASASKRRRR